MEYLYQDVTIIACFNKLTMEEFDSILFSNKIDIK